MWMKRKSQSVFESNSGTERNMRIGIVMDTLWWGMKTVDGGQMVFSDAMRSLGIGMIDDVADCMDALGWLERRGVDRLPQESDSVYMSSAAYVDSGVDRRRAEYEVRYLLRLWDVLPTSRLVELLRMGMTEEMVYAMVDNDIDPNMMMTMKNAVQD